MVDIDTTDGDRYMRRAIDLAREAGERGDGPYGSVLVHDGEIIMEEGNRTQSDDDLALHPELTLARRAGQELTPAQRAETVMYTSTEPCAMCAGGISIAGLGGVVYSVSGEQTADLYGGSPGIPCGEVFDRRGVDIAVKGGVLEEEGLSLHHDFR
ncbi:MAG: nucleoside deaminase [Halobacteriales archaeon]|nr:nucleoside deaminase [Halobacteriales archaeon]